MQTRPNQSRQNISNSITNQNNINYNNTDYINEYNPIKIKSTQMQPINGNVYLPPITDGNNQNFNMDIRNIHSREREKINNQQHNIFDNYSKSNLLQQNDSNFLIQEINNLKKIIKKLVETQADSQLRMNEYTKIFSEQDSNFRINNIKLNEHDSKITEILMTFNNYLSLNDQSTKVINDLTSNFDTLAKRADIADIRNKFSNFDKIMDGKLLDLNSKYEDLYVKFQEISK